eukprot:4698842-Pyramimonas_sp.AAC.1
MPPSASGVRPKSLEVSDGDGESELLIGKDLDRGRLVFTTALDEPAVADADSPGDVDLVNVGDV